MSVRIRLIAVLIVLASASALSAGVDSTHATPVLVVNTVTDTDDTTCDGTHCSLREAINAANANAGADTINFNVASGCVGGVCAITLGSGLPALVNQTTINGYSQSGASANTNPNGQPINADIRVEIDVSAAVGAAFVIVGSNNTIRGLSIYDSANVGIIIMNDGSTGNTIAGNFIGLDASAADAGNDLVGVRIEGGLGTGPTGNTVGGALPADRNLISGNEEAGVELSFPSQNNTVQGNYIGTDAAGATHIPNGRGVLINDGSTDNLIGGNTAGERNLISGNDDDGVVIAGEGTDTNTVSANYIGVDAAGNAELTNGDGILIEDGAAANTVGGDSAGEQNVIVGSASIWIRASDDNVVSGNYIGTDPTGTVDLAISQGIYVSGAATGNLIGGDEPAERNVISGDGDAVLISGVGATLNTVSGNYIGVDASGSSAIGNSGWGVSLFGASENTVGGDSAGERNIISGNQLGVRLVSGAAANTVKGNYIGTNPAGDAAIGNEITGVSIFNASSNDVHFNVISGNSFNAVSVIGTSQFNHIAGNFIGTNAAGDAAIPNGVGVSLQQGPTGNVIGGPDPPHRNVISGNDQHGVRIQDATTFATVVTGNYIGTNATGDAALANGENGVEISGSPSNFIDSNVVSGNVGIGVRLFGLDAHDNVVQGNLVGTDAAGNSAIPNEANGVLIDDSSPSNVIDSNLISGNASEAIRVTGGSFQNQVTGNLVGTNAAGGAAIPNKSGVLVDGGTSNYVGGSDAASRNVISGNIEDGVVISGTAQQTYVYGNYIGTNIDGDSPLGNGENGVLALGPAFAVQMIGGSGPGEGNLIAFNGGTGVLIGTPQQAATGTVILNSIHSNGGLGIDLDGDGVTANDAGDVDGGSNFAQNFPDLTSAEVTNSITIHGTLDSTPETLLGIHLFVNDDCDPTGYGEGQTFIDGFSDTTDADGSIVFTVEFSADIAPGMYITATVFNPFNYATSEFSNCVEVVDPNATPTPIGQTPTPTPTPTPPGQMPTATPTPPPPGQTPTPTPPGQTPTPTPTGEPLPHTQGDNDCDGDSDAVDALVSLQTTAGIDPNQQPNCPELGQALPASGDPPLFGDIDCDGDVDAVDALQILRNVAGLPVNQTVPCPNIGDPL